MARSNHASYSQLTIVLIVTLFAFCTSGCSTLSSLGIPVGTPANRLLKRAKEISEAPGQSFLVPKELAITPMDSYIVEIADTLSVEPVSFDAEIRLPGDQVVKPDGSISLGEFGSYVANGKSVQQIRLEIQSQIDEQIRSQMEVEFAKAQAQQSTDQPSTSDLDFDSESDEEDEDSDSLDLDSDEDARAEQRRERAAREFERRVDEKLNQNRVSVRVTNWESKKIYVLGEVNSPGSFPYIGNETVLDAIIEAGGLASKANHHSIIVSRPSSCGDCRTIMKICYDQIVQMGDASTNYQLMPGDRVFVPSMTFMDDLKRTFNPAAGEQCPRCSGCDVGCDLPTGCE